MVRKLVLALLLVWPVANCAPSEVAHDASVSPDGPSCDEGESACDGICIDTESDVDNCGGCGVACNVAELESCVASNCVPPECEPGETASCYSDSAETLNVGPCKAGERTCEPTGKWGPCIGEVTPVYEMCGNDIDDNCNGEVNENSDLDGDGFSTCDGDCCDAPGPACSDPALVNPGAFEVDDNGVDDDCDGAIDNALPECDVGLASNSADPLDYAAAIELCQTAPEGGDLIDQRWGVIDAEFVLADGSGSAAFDSRSIREDFGPNVSAQAGASMALLSTGVAAALDHESPGYAPFQIGSEMGTSSAMPADWLAANNNDLPNAPGCPEPQEGDANDPIMLRLRVRVPTNARSFSMNLNFFSSEYPEFVCSPFNDFLVILLNSSFDGSPANPADSNLAIYTAPDGSKYPVGVNLAFGDIGLFRQCKNGATGCHATAVDSETTTCESLDEITGTGLDEKNAPSAGGPGKCGQNDLAGGGTGWLQTSGNVTPGEIMVLRIAIWDTSDTIYDSLVLIDNFQWSVEASEPGTDVVVL